MIDPLSATTSVIASINHANQIIKAVLDARDKHSNLEQFITLQTEIATINTGYIALTQQNQSLLAEIDNLKKEITNFEEWDNQKKRYKLYSPWDSAVVYAITESQSNGEPPHWICAECYNSRKRSFLNSRKNRDSGYEEFFCNCGAIVSSHHRGKHKVEYCPE